MVTPAKKLTGNPGNPGLSSTSQTTSGDRKTSIQDLKNDDDVLKVLYDAERELTGKVSPAESWQPLFDVLAKELKIAAGRTSVSSVPAFFAEHLWRRLNKAPASATAAPSARIEPVPLPFLRRTKN